MKKSPKPIRKAKVEPSFSHYLEGLKVGQPLELVLVGHLVLDALLVELIQLKIVGDTPWKWHFPTKVQCCVDNGFLSPASQPVYARFNDIRNDFAHMLGHKLTFDAVFALVTAQLQKPLSVLELSDYQRTALKNIGINTIGDALSSTEETFQKAYYIGPKRSRRIMNVATAAVLEYLSG